MSGAQGTTVYWFRKALRLHDNPALVKACERASQLYPVFCMDPYFAKPHLVGPNRYAFLLESLAYTGHEVPLMRTMRLTLYLV